MDRPWAYGLSRLLTARPGLKKGVLAERADLKGGTISGLLNGPKPPHVATLQKLADALTAYDRLKNPQAPAVQLWEFFVSDEQAMILKQADQTRQHLAKQENLAAVVIRQLAPAVAAAVAAAVTGLSTPAQTPTTATDASTRSDDQPADGRLRRGRRAS